MFYYAVVDVNYIVTEIQMDEVEINEPNYIPIESADYDLVGLWYNIEDQTYSHVGNKYLIPLKVVDGAGCGLDADKLDGKQASEFALAGHTHTGYASSDHVHTGYAASEHTHDYAPSTHTHDYAPSTHTHDEYIDRDWVLLNSANDISQYLTTEVVTLSDGNKVHKTTLNADVKFEISAYTSWMAGTKDRRTSINAVATLDKGSVFVSREVIDATADIANAGYIGLTSAIAWYGSGNNSGLYPIVFYAGMSLTTCSGCFSADKDGTHSVITLNYDTNFEQIKSCYRVKVRQ